MFLLGAFQLHFSGCTFKNIKYIVRLRKTGDAAGHIRAQDRDMETVCVKVVGGYLYAPRYHPMVVTLFMTVFVGQDMVNFPAPQKLDPQAPKSSQNRGIFDVCAKPKTTSVAKTPLFATLSQHNMSAMLYFYSVFCMHETP